LLLPDKKTKSRLEVVQGHTFWHQSIARGVPFRVDIWRWVFEERRP